MLESVAQSKPVFITSKDTLMFTQIPFLAGINFLQLCGIAGFILYIYAFSAVQFGWISGNSATFSVVNIAAASLVALSLVADFNLASALIQGSWITIGLVGLIRRIGGSSCDANDDFETTKHLGASS